MILMDLNEQVDWDFSRALRKARLRRLVLRLRGKLASRGNLPSLGEVQGALRAYNRVRRGIRVVDLEKIVGSVGRSRDFDRSFMPLRVPVGERWKRVDLAFYRDQALPPVSLYKLGDAYFVEDGNHRISVARYHGFPDVEAEVTELWAMSTLPSAACQQFSTAPLAPCQHAQASPSLVSTPPDGGSQHFSQVVSYPPHERRIGAPSARFVARGRARPERQKLKC